jgi:hypothetical protein
LSLGWRRLSTEAACRASTLRRDRKDNELMDIVLMALCFAFLGFIAGYTMGKHDAIGYIQSFFDALHVMRLRREYDDPDLPQYPHVSPPTPLRQDRFDSASDEPDVGWGGGS